MKFAKKGMLISVLNDLTGSDYSRPIYIIVDVNELNSMATYYNIRSGNYVEFSSVLLDNEEMLCDAD